MGTKAAMRARTRTFLFVLIVIAFVVIAPLLVLYAKGYSFRPDDRSVILTGTILVDTNVSKVQVSLDGAEEHTENDPVILRGLEPGSHTLAISREGYHPWKATLEVKPEKVTRVDDVVLSLVDPEIQQPITNTIGRFAVSPNSRFIVYTVTEGKDQGLWMHTNGNEENRRLLAPGDGVDVTTISEIRWSQNSRLLLIRDDQRRYWRILPHISTPTALALDELEGIPASQVLLDHDEPSTVYYRDSKSDVYRWATARNNALPELLAKDVTDFAVATPKIFTLEPSTGRTLQLTSYDVRESDPIPAHIATVPDQDASLVVGSSSLVATIAGDELMLLTRVDGTFALESVAQNVSYAEWSEDGLFLAYQSGSELWIHDQEPLQDEPELFKIGELTQQPSKIFWHPNSRHLTLFTESDEDRIDVTLVHAARNAPLTQEVASLSTILDPQYARGGADLVYATASPDQGLILHSFTEKIE